MKALNRILITFDIGLVYPVMIVLYKREIYAISLGVLRMLQVLQAKQPKLDFDEFNENFETFTCKKDLFGNEGIYKQSASLLT